MIRLHRDIAHIMGVPPTPRPPRRHWTDDAACRNTLDPEQFFPPPNSQGRAAKAICATCPVTAPCLTWAVEHREAGVWGGTLEADRGRRRTR